MDNDMELEGSPKGETPNMEKLLHDKLGPMAGAKPQNSIEQTCNSRIARLLHRHLLEAMGLEKQKSFGYTRPPTPHHEIEKKVKEIREAFDRRMKKRIINQKEKRQIK
ncbi:hypothetical protein AHAS_Ahas05G0217600 [Arachis hypogaea]